MANKSISQKESEINHQFELIDNLSDYIDEMRALTEIGINCDFGCISEHSIKNYCYTLLSLATSAKETTNKLINILQNN
jgi:hypothetical protein